jgi:hypothetical protein
VTAATATETTTGEAGAAALFPRNPACSRAKCPSVVAHTRSLPIYRIDSLHPDRLVCEACARTVGAVNLDPGGAPLGALPAGDASAEWPELVEAIREHEGRCGSGAEEVVVPAHLAADNDRL